MKEKCDETNTNDGITMKLWPPCHLTKKRIFQPVFSYLYCKKDKGFHRIPKFGAFLKPFRDLDPNDLAYVLCTEAV